eukprot:GDKI01031455.1.p1 GENE.GDKI01031455.1~~GDKI01031455.1.p1  ORF type:complete len:223 (+),score=15.97 GDKI01031455.1:32-700(+)
MAFNSLKLLATATLCISVICLVLLWRAELKAQSSNTAYSSYQQHVRINANSNSRNSQTNENTIPVSHGGQTKEGGVSINSQHFNEIPLEPARIHNVPTTKNLLTASKISSEPLLTPFPPAAPRKENENANGNVSGNSNMNFNGDEKKNSALQANAEGEGAAIDGGGGEYVHMYAINVPLPNGGYARGVSTVPPTTLDEHMYNTAAEKHTAKEKSRRENGRVT